MILDMKVVCNLPLVDWGMGTTIIVVFGVVCIVLAVMIYSMVQSGKGKDEN